MRIPEIKFHAKKREYYFYLNRKYRYLGRSKADAERAKIRILAAEASCEMMGLENRGPVLVADLVAAFLNSHQDSSSLINYRIAGRYLVETFAITPVSEFGPNLLRAVREKIVASNVSRQYVNKLIGLIRTIFNWGVSHEMVPAETAGSLKYVRAIGQGHSISPESPQVTPVNESDVAATLPFLSPTVAAMVQIQLITGMRPSEVCELRLSEIDQSGPTWTYTKSHHKNAWRGQQRIVPLGPKAREILAVFVPLVESDGIDFLFSPRRTEAARRAEQRRRRRTKVQPSQQDRRNPNAKRTIHDHYSAESYARAISRAAQKAGVQHWFPYQLRHTAATRIRRQYGLEAAQVILGHASIEASQIYAERDLARAMKIAESDG